MAGLEDLYREIILDHYRAPRNRGELPSPPAHKVEGFNPLCGDEVVLYLDVDDDGIVGLPPEHEAHQTVLTGRRTLQLAVVATDADGVIGRHVRPSRSCPPVGVIVARIARGCNAVAEDGEGPRTVQNGGGSG